MKRLLLGLVLLCLAVQSSGWVPDWYYSSPCQQPANVSLEVWLSTLEWIPYEAGVFDCTEMSVRIEWLAENCGYDTIIGCDEGHCWVLVEGRAFEPTGNYWVARDHLGVNDYYNPAEVHSSLPTGPAWDWWNTISNQEVN